MAKIFCNKCGRMFNGKRGTMLCDNCKLEEYMRRKKEAKEKQPK